jgi:hypothetical protein
MQTQEGLNDFFIWGVDDAPYGPVELPTLVSWIKDERVLADSWIFARRDGAWRRAEEIPELRMFFGKKPAAQPGPTSGAGITPGALRRVKILAEMSDAQLDLLNQFMEVQRAPQLTVVVKQGDQGDAMFLIMEGELRARVIAAGRETIVAAFGPGDFFGDMSLFDHGPRSADVVANVDSVLLKISTAAFSRMTREVPALAAPFLQATARTMAARIRANNKQLNRVSQQFSSSSM